MPNINKLHLAGNLTRDPELRYTTNNTPVCNFGVASNRKRGEREETFFGECEAWGKTAEAIDKFFAKGRPIYVEGRLKTEQWEDKKDGSKRSKTRVIVEAFEFLDSKRDGDGEEPRDEEPPAPPVKQQGDHEALGDDDIPF